MKNDSLQIVMKDVVIEHKLSEMAFNIFMQDLQVFDGFLTKVENGVVCFTGNRPTSLPWRYNEECELFKDFRCKLKTLLEKLISCGYNKFISGVAMGFDIIAAEVALQLKEMGAKIELECAVPCLNQTRGWKDDYVSRYHYILDNADKVTFTSSYAYFDGCYAIRNKYMVDNADLVVGLQLKKSSGTESTLNYARTSKKKIIVIN